MVQTDSKKILSTYQISTMIHLENFFFDCLKAYVFICYNNEDNKRIEVLTSEAMEKWRSLTMKIVWTKNLKNKEKTCFHKTQSSKCVCTIN